VLATRRNAPSGYTSPVRRMPSWCHPNSRGLTASRTSLCDLTSRSLPTAAAGRSGHVSRQRRSRHGLRGLSNGSTTPALISRAEYEQTRSRRETTVASPTRSRAPPTSRGQRDRPTPRSPTAAGGWAQTCGNVDVGARIRREARLSDRATNSTARWPHVRNCAPILDQSARDRGSSSDDHGCIATPGFYRFGAQ
jgi:hypothetical protein